MQPLLDSQLLDVSGFRGGFMVIGPKLGGKIQQHHWVPGSRSHCHTSNLLLCDPRDNSTCLIGLLWGLKEIKHINHFEQCQTHAKHSTNVSYYGYDSLWLGPTQKLAQATITQMTNEWDPGRLCFWRPPAMWWRESCPLVQRPLKASTVSFLEKWSFFCKYGMLGTCAIWSSSPVSCTLFTFCSFRIRELTDSTLEMGDSLWQVVWKFLQILSVSCLRWEIHLLEMSMQAAWCQLRSAAETTANSSAWRITLLRELGT